MSKKSKQKVNSALGFTPSHLLLIAGSLVLLLVFSILKGNLTMASLMNLNPLKAAEQTTGVLSYDQIRAHVDATYTAQHTPDEKSKQQLAEVDPTYGIGDVLGDSTQGIPSVEEILTQEQVDSIKIKTFQTNNVKDLQHYVDKIKFIENYYGAPALIQAFTTQDTALLKQADIVYQTLITEFKNMPVPAPMEEHQQYKILYYASLIDMARSMVSEDDSSTTAGAVFFSLQDKIDSIQMAVTQKYGIAF